jgi:hypothetical protein
MRLLIQHLLAQHRIIFHSRVPHLPDRIPISWTFTPTAAATPAHWAFGHAANSADANIERSAEHPQVRMKMKTITNWVPFTSSAESGDAFGRPMIWSKLC